MEREFYVKLDINEAIDLIKSEIEKGSFTGKLVDRRVIEVNDKKIINLIFIKHFFRVKNHVTLTITMDDLNDKLRVYLIGSGGGGGFFTFDWGAADAFEEEVYNILKKYIIK